MAMPVIPAIISAAVSQRTLQVSALVRNRKAPPPSNVNELLMFIKASIL